MSGRARLPGGTARKASQRHARPAAPTPIVTGPVWKPGDRVIWRDCPGQYLRDVDAGQAHVLIGARTYLVAVGELRPAPGWRRVAPRALLQQLPGALDFAFVLALQAAAIATAGRRSW